MNQEYWIEQAKRAAETAGLPWEWIYAQWYHETGGFTSDVLRDYNNAGGLFRPDLQDYIVFPTIDDFVNYWANYIQGYRDDGIYEAKTPEEYALALASNRSGTGKYYTDDPANYISGMLNAIAGLGDNAGGSNFNSPVSSGAKSTSFWDNWQNPLTLFDSFMESIGKASYRFMMALFGSILFILGMVLLNRNTVQTVIMQKEGSSSAE